MSGNTLSFTQFYLIDYFLRARLFICSENIAGTLFVREHVEDEGMYEVKGKVT